MATEPDPRTAPDDDEDATNHGESASEPAEGSDHLPDERQGSPRG
jgi:hypothetical protein